MRNIQLRRFSIVKHLCSPPPPPPTPHSPPPRYSFSRHVSHQLKLTLNDMGDNVAVVGGGGGGQQQRQQQQQQQRKTYIERQGRQRCCCRLPPSWRHGTNRDLKIEILYN